MMKPRSVASLPICLLAVACLAPPPSTSAARQEGDAKIWVGHYREVEEYLRTAECVSMEDIAKSVPGAKRCVLRPGGPVSRMLWKPQIPGAYRGFRERYTAEIAAYELDKLLKLDMVPPVVERELGGYTGSATLWVENLLASSGGASPTPADRSRWEKHLTLKMMFDNLIGNKDRNEGNTLRDASWNMILLDHTRAFGSTAELPHRLTRIDKDSWARIEKLTRSQLDDVLRPWLDANDIAAILERRDRMKADIDKRAGEAGFVQGGEAGLVQ